MILTQGPLTRLVPLKSISQPSVLCGVCSVVMAQLLKHDPSLTQDKIISSNYSFEVQKELSCSKW